MDPVGSVEQALDVVEQFVPPTDEKDLSAMRRWRRWISLATFFSAAGLAVHIALACGFAAPFYPGFASAADITALQAQLKNDKEETRVQRIATLESSILDAKQKHCAAAPAVKSLYLDAYLKLKIEYEKLTGQAYPSLDCKDF